MTKQEDHYRLCEAVGEGKTRYLPSEGITLCSKDSCPYQNTVKNVGYNGEGICQANSFVSKSQDPDFRENLRKRKSFVERIVKEIENSLTSQTRVWMNSG